MITNDVKDPVKAMEIYRRKDAVEKGFDDLKNDLDCKRL
jgi:transposase